jgi:hypothetical protein
MMKKIIYSKFDKHAIGTLPKVSFPGRIITIFTEADIDTAVDYLLDSDLLGVDTETKPVFKQGQSYKVSLLQVSTHDTCFLFRLNMTGNDSCNYQVPGRYQRPEGRPFLA